MKNQHGLPIRFGLQAIGLQATVAYGGLGRQIKVQLPCKDMICAVFTGDYHLIERLFVDFF